MSRADPSRDANARPGGAAAAGPEACEKHALRIAPDHPAFAGHFPGRPVLPAVVVLSEVLAALEARTARMPQQWTIATAKFQDAIAPDESLTIAHTDTASGGIRFEVRSARSVVASGTLTPRHAS